jgi:hypothetical protein
LTPFVRAFLLDVLDGRIDAGDPARTVLKLGFAVAEALAIVNTRTLARPLVVEVHHGVLGELLELGAQSCAFRDKPRNGVVRRRQEGAGEAGDCCLENRP